MTNHPAHTYLVDLINDATSLAAEYGHDAVEPIHLATVMQDLTGEVLPDPLEADLLLHLCEPRDALSGQEPELSTASYAILDALDGLAEEITEELLVSRLSEAFTATIPMQAGCGSLEYQELVATLPQTREPALAELSAASNRLRALIPWNRR